MKNLFKPPVFADEEKTQTARMLFALFWTGLAIATGAFFMAAVLPDAAGRSLTVGMRTCVLTLAGYLLTRRGLTTAASWLMTLGIWGAATVAAWSTGGISAPAVTLYLIVVLTAGMLFGELYGFFAGGLCILTELFLVFAEKMDLLPRSVVHHTIVYRWLVNTTLVVGVVALQYFPAKMKKQLLERTNQELMERRRSEAALRESEAKHRRLIETTSEGYWQIDTLLRTADVNEALCQMLGHGREEMLGRTPFDFVDEESRWVFEASISRIAEEDHRSYEMTLRKKDGLPLHARFNATTMRDEAGELQGSFSFVTDITAQRQSEMELRRSEEKYRSILENMDEGYYETNLRGDYTFANDAMCRLFGYTKEELTGINYRHLTTDEQSAKEIFHTFEQVYYQNMPRRGIDWKFVTRDGSRISVDFSIFLIKNANDRITGFRGVFRDVTEQKKVESELAQHRQHLESLVASRTDELTHANGQLRNEIGERVRVEEALRKSEELLTKLIASIPDTIIRTDVEGNILYMNEAFLMLTGLCLEELVGKNMLAIVVPEERKSVAQDMALMFKERLGPKEYHLITKDGVRLFEINGDVLRNTDGSPYGIVYLGRDVTERKRAEKALRESEDRLRTIIEGTQALLVRVDADGRLTYANDATAEALGYKTATEIIGRLYLDFVHSDDRRRVLNNMIHQAEAVRPSSMQEFRIVDTEGLVKWFSFISTLVIKDGQFIGMTGVAQNITERKQAEEALRKSEARYRTFFEHTAVGVAEIEHVTGRFLTANPRLCELLGRTEEEMRDTTFQAITHPDDLHLHEEKVAHLLAGTIDHYTLEKRYISKDGSVIWVNITVSDPRETGETHGRNIVIVEDITERKRTGAALQASEEKFRQIVSSIPNVVSILDMNLRFTYVSASVQRILGYTPEEAMALSLDQIFTPESLAIVGKSFQERLEANVKGSDPNYVLILELEEYHKNGSTVFLENTMTFLRNTNGVPVGILSVSADITERKRTEAALQASKDAADAANQSKSIFLANMSHEIRTPMNAILGFAQLMQRDQDLSLQSREYLNIINRSGEHLLALINDILEMSKIEAGRATFVPNTFDLHYLLNDLEMMFRVRTDAKKLQFLSEKVGDVPRWVITDEGKLRQVLINLLGNAVKFTEEGGIALRLHAKVGEGETIDLQFEVEDTGPGMDEEEISRLFQAFEQTRTGIKIGGSGLGLALSRGFVQIMGGSISVAGAIGKGTTLRFEVPVREGTEKQAPLKEAKRRVLRLRPGQSEIRVLVADDRETNRQLLSQLLVAVGFPIREVVNGAEAVCMVHEWKPQVVLMDMTMPVMDGYEATCKIKASPDIKNTAIIAVTASAFEEDRQRIFAAGADGYLSKPFKEADLFENIGRLTGAEYLYEETGGSEKTQETADDMVLMRKNIASLPPDLVGQLRDAVESADLDRLNNLVGQLITDHPTLAQRIQEMAARYEYETLIALFSPGA